MSKDMTRGLPPRPHVAAVIATLRETNHNGFPVVETYSKAQVYKFFDLIDKAI